MGLGNGTLACTNLCNYDTSDCTQYQMSSCGDGIKNGMDICDGTAFTLDNNECDRRSLGAGTLACTDTCQLDVSGCDAGTDLCAAFGWYDDGICDVCVFHGGLPDRDCDLCGVDDGICPEWFDTQGLRWTCSSQGRVDVDCGVCGNGVQEGAEFCDGLEYGHKSRCIDWGAYTGGEIGCRADCTPDFTDCE